MKNFPGRKVWLARNSLPSRDRASKKKTPMTCSVARSRDVTHDLSFCLRSPPVDFLHEQGDRAVCLYQTLHKHQPRECKKGRRCSWGVHDIFSSQSCTAFPTCHHARCYKLYIPRRNNLHEYLAPRKRYHRLFKTRYSATSTTTPCSIS